MTTSLRLTSTLALLSAGLVGIGLYRAEALQVLPTPLGESAVVGLIESPPEAQVTIRRVKAKSEVIDRVRRGEITLFEAAAWFRHLNSEPPEYPENSWRQLRGDCNNEKVCRQVILWVDGQLGGKAPANEVDELVMHLEAELQRHLAEHGSVILPGWEAGT
jgi:hypothetical protein